jgi:hypothetical protein
MKIFIFHGAYGHPGENWFPWLKAELEKLGATVIVPKFPTPADQSLESWMNVVGLYQIGPNDVLIGHSIGAALAMKILEEHKVKAAFLVAGVFKCGRDKLLLFQGADAIQQDENQL